MLLASTAAASSTQSAGASSNHAGSVMSMLVGPGGGGFSCMACGVDLWDVPRHVRAGNVVVCERCLGAMSDALERGAPSGRVDVVIPPRVSGPVPDDDAVASVVDAFLRTFGNDADRNAEVMEDAEELRPMLDH